LQISSDEYSIIFDDKLQMVVCRGSLHLSGMREYQPILELLLTTLDCCSSLTLNLRDLEILNSSGINMLMLFILKVRDRGGMQLVLQGSNQILWQTKSLRNLQRLMPQMVLDMA
jgi:hypothetical protein